MNLSLKLIIPGILALIWLITLIPLMIIDVWDESNFLIYFYTQPQPLWEKLSLIWSQPLGNLYRPIPVSLASIILAQIEFSNFAWQILRWFNVGLLLGSLIFMLQVLHRWQVAAILFPVITLLFLFSSSAIITASWYANIFDANSWFLLSLALLLITYQRFNYAAILIGLSFFCKEINLIFIIFVVILYFNHKLSLANLSKIIIISLSFAAVYWLLRMQLINFASEGDIHNFNPNLFIPSMLGFVESFWWQNMHRQQADWLGIVIFGLVLLSFKRFINILLFLWLLVAAMLIYWGMFAYYQQDIIISHLNFIGRLYLIPAGLMLIGLSLWARPWILGLIMLPLLWGGWQSYQAHKTLQLSYLQIVTLAAEQPTAIFIDYKHNPLQDPIRKIYIGDYPQAAYKLDDNGSLIVINQR